MEFFYYGKQPLDKVKMVVLTSHSMDDTDSVYLNYIKPLVNRNALVLDDILVLRLPKPTGKKPSAKEVRDDLAEVVEICIRGGASLLQCTSPEHYKKLTDIKNTTGYVGQLVEVALGDSENSPAIRVCLCYSYRSFIYTPSNSQQNAEAINIIGNFFLDKPYERGVDVINTAIYPKTIEEVEGALKLLLTKPRLSIDTETTGLNFMEDTLESIAFAWSKHDGCAFMVDRDKEWGSKVKPLLKKFFQEYKNTCIYHNAQFDLKMLVSNLWTDRVYDTATSLDALDILTRDVNCTQVMVYLATNNTTSNNLTLKHNAAPFLGVWAEEDIKDAASVPEARLLPYNLRDTLATMYLFDKHTDTLIEELQYDIYKEHWIPSIKTLTYTEICGIPTCRYRVNTMADTLKAKNVDLHKELHSNSLVQQYVRLLEQQACDAHNLKLSTKIIPLSQYANTMKFNPNSSKQLTGFLFNFLGYTPTEFTPKGEPKGDRDAIKRCLNNITNEDHRIPLQALIDLSELSSIISTFIPAFLKGGDRLQGSFKLGGTQSTRLSSSSPNLTNIPATGSTYAKIVKWCVKAPEGELFLGSDFNALEAVTDALVTKDPNKLKIYTEGYDSHCLMAYTYWPEKMPDIVQADTDMYAVTVDGVTTYYSPGSIIETDNGKYKVEDLC